MFIRLTRTDGQPIWINASFVVTVEPARSGGSVVVPIGDGLDYDVKETPETVLALLDEAPPAKVVPVPPPKALTPTPDDVSPEVGFRRGDEEESKLDEPPETKDLKTVPKKRTGRAKSPAKKAERPAEKNPEKAPRPTETQGDSSVPHDFDKIVADLKARKCRTGKRMRNAIKSYFGKTDEAEIDHIIETMINRGYMLIGADGHIDWTA